MEDELKIKKEILKLYEIFDFDPHKAQEFGMYLE